jgi:uncharacterized protein (TIGR02594 family)
MKTDNNLPNRREVVRKLAAFGAFSVPVFYSSVSAFALPDKIGEEAGANLLELGPIPNIEAFLRQYSTDTGEEKAYGEEVTQAERIWDACPTNTSPFQIAFYFYELALGQLNHLSNDGNSIHKYAMEWPKRANPLIVNFFSATNYGNPAGDTTAWCSAFVNWCIERATKGKDASKTNGMIGRTKSAASKSFREWGKATSNPNVGDIVVFRNPKDDNFGHVGFYIGMAGAKILVLGGNQGPYLGTKNTGEVNVKPFSEKSNDLVLVGFRTAKDLEG